MSFNPWMAGQGGDHNFFHLCRIFQILHNEYLSIYSYHQEKLNMNRKKPFLRSSRHRRTSLSNPRCLITSPTCFSVEELMEASVSPRCSAGRPTAQLARDFNTPWQCGEILYIRDGHRHRTPAHAVGRRPAKGGAAGSAGPGQYYSVRLSRRGAPPCAAPVGG